MNERNHLGKEQDSTDNMVLHMGSFVSSMWAFIHKIPSSTPQICVVVKEY